MLPVDQISALILAGGRGSRLGGQDKGLIDLMGQPMIAHVLSVLRTQVHMVLVSANRHIEEYQALGTPVVKDRLSDYQGPLAGIEAGLTVCPTPYLAIFPCDAPCLDRALLPMLYEEMERTNTDIVYALSRQGERLYPEPTFALIRADMLSSLRRFLDAGNRKLLDWYQQADYAEVLFEDLRCFANANTDLDLVQLQQQLASRENPR